MAYHDLHHGILQLFAEASHRGRETFARSEWTLYVDTRGESSEAARVAAYRAANPARCKATRRAEYERLKADPEKYRARVLAQLARRKARRAAA